MNICSEPIFCLTPSGWLNPLCKPETDLHSPLGWSKMEAATSLNAPSPTVVPFFNPSSFVDNGNPLWLFTAIGSSSIDLKTDKYLLPNASIIKDSPPVTSDDLMIILFQ
ncbi:hypothetical protein Hanom_Chr10g00954821 [Helianthus anomalus]